MENAFDILINVTVAIAPSTFIYFRDKNEIKFHCCRSGNIKNDCSFVYLCASRESKMNSLNLLRREQFDFDGPKKNRIKKENATSHIHHL